MIESLSRRQAVVLGLVVVVVLALGGWGLFAVGERQGLWQERVHVWARFPQISGIEVGTRVRVQGIQAGQIQAIEQPAERGGHVLVLFSIDEKFLPLLGADARAVVLSEGLIGGKVVELETGTIGTLQAGAVIEGQPDLMMTRMRELAGKGAEMVGDVQRLTQQAQRTLEEAEGLIGDVRAGRGPVGRELIGSLKQLQQSSESVEQSFGAMKHLPIFGRYVDTPTKTLVRPSVQQHLFVIDAAELFDPGKAILTSSGKAKLDTLAANDLTKLKVSGSEVVVAVYTDSSYDVRTAEILTQEQGEAVRTYLVDQHQVNRLTWWSRRNVTALGMGTRPPPGQTNASPSLPPQRVEIIVFVPPEAGK